MRPSQHPPPLLLLYCNGNPPLELLVAALVVTVHFVMAVPAPHHGVVRPALLVVNPQVRAVIPVVVRHIRNVHLLLRGMRAQVSCIVRTRLSLHRTGQLGLPSFCLHASSSHLRDLHLGGRKSIGHGSNAGAGRERNGSESSSDRPCCELYQAGRPQIKILRTFR